MQVDAGQKASMEAFLLKTFPDSAGIEHIVVADACSMLELALITSSRVFFLHCKIYAFDNPEGPRGKIPRPPDRHFIH